MDHSQHPTELYKRAEAINTWWILLPFPCLLLRWQNHHSKDNHRIATIASHRLGKHRLCKDKCSVINDWLHTKLVACLAGVLEERRVLHIEQAMHYDL